MTTLWNVGHPLYGNIDGSLSDAERAFITDKTYNKRTAVVTGLAAARIRGIKTYSPLTCVDFIYPNDRTAPGRNKWKPGTRYISDPLPFDEIEFIDGIRVAPMNLVLLHTQKLYGDLDALIVTDSWRYQNPNVTAETLQKLVDDLQGRSGVQGLRRTVGMSKPGTRSPLESLARYRILEGNIPEIHSIEYEVEIYVMDETGMIRKYYADILINGFLIVEADGRLKYQNAFGEPVESVLLKEKYREQALQNAGFVVRRVEWGDCAIDPIGSCRLVTVLRRTLQHYPEPTVPLRS